MTNLFWSDTRGADVAGFTQTGADLFWQVAGSVSQDLSDGVQFQGGIEEDPVLKRRVYARLGFDMESLTIRFTPFLGVLNTTQKWFNPGLEASVGYTFPGLGSLTGGFSTSFAPLSKVGDYYLSSEYASLVVFLDNGILTLSVDDRSSIVRKTSLLDVQNYLTAYRLDTELFVKNFPVRTAIILGYQTAGRSYIATTPNETPLNSILVGMRLMVNFGTFLSVYGEGVGSVFNFGTLDTKVAVPDSSMLYQVQSGIKFHY
ncbi:MAG: hypothetical protein WCG80_07205 [Spirochaetales bacterium]